MGDRKKLQNPVSLFPLPATVFYPGAFLPLHIFEPRYRQMVIDNFKNHRLIGVILLKPGWEENYYDKPAVVSIGCAGKIETMQPLPDGKFNVILKGLSRFRILQEKGNKSYRLAEVDFSSEINDELIDFTQSSRAMNLLSYYEEYVELLPPQHQQKKKTELKNCRWLSCLVDQISYQFDFKLEDKQLLLEELDVSKRVETIIWMLKLKIRIVNTSKFFREKGIDTQMN